MKKLLLGSIVLSAFALSITLVQISCSKSDAQQNRTMAPTGQLNKIIYFTDYPGPNAKIWIANYDGTGATQIPVVLPTNVEYDQTVNTQTLRISPDGQTIFFSATDKTQPLFNASIYSCDASGNNVRLVVTSTTAIFLGQAY